jgi:hypothetical protein
MDANRFVVPASYKYYECDNELKTGVIFLGKESQNQNE